MRNPSSLMIGDVSVDDLPVKIGVAAELDELKERIASWLKGADAELQPMLRWQLLGRSKYFRPLTIFACHFAMTDEPVPAPVMNSAAALEIFHNVSLIVDDILDRSRTRRGKSTLHCRYGVLPALMTSGYLTAAGFKLVRDDAYSIGILGELMQRLGVAECLQWRLRRQPLGVEDWRIIAQEDTGSMFEACACLGTRDGSLRTFGRLLGLVYHGCDDVGDVRGAAALGGGGEEDIRDGILTLPAAIAIRNPKFAALFRDPRDQDAKMLIKVMSNALPEAERYLDGIAAEARDQALAKSSNAESLIALVEHTRALSKS
jgi:geranylgeranyl pyrophosphate synthase